MTGKFQESSNIILQLNQIPVIGFYGYRKKDDKSQSEEEKPEEEIVPGVDHDHLNYSCPF